ncbi:hypothetical protein NQ314_005749 [Rhamnusium bicolor]|uniref:MATH domain-containing protein n=1 Tax=Rhamnusium bicolor TaxID=1586634 RepID=A0AAV8ZFF4_9CUCU|nr:hypothetical protein NQ314_005749 [Rhamnusium bicolor]
MAEAKNKEGMELVSPPFYTSQYGYKLQASLFPNGNGAGEDSHISFHSPSSTSQLAQKKACNIVESFIPDPTWKNFQRPSREPDSLGFGFPKFVSYEMLKKRHFMKDDTMFIRVKVDPSKIVAMPLPSCRQESGTLPLESSLLRQFLLKIPGNVLQKKTVEELDEEEEEQKLREESGLARSGVLFGGLLNDIKRKVPWYWSDFKDALAMQCIASWIFLYFACLSPIITFGGLLSEATGRNMAAMESLVSGFVCGMGYGFFSGQPLTILGSTGPVLVFETIVYDFCGTMGWDYLSFRFWIGTWIAIILLILVAIDASALVCYITRFTEENFATLIAFIFIYKAVENVLAIGKKYPVNTTGSTNFSVGCSCFVNESVANQYPNIANTTTVNQTLCLVRQFISDFAVIIAILSMSFLDFKVGIPTPKLEVPHEFKPTLPNRGWIIAPFNHNPFYSVFVAIPPALLGTILIFMDQQITSVIINRKEYKLKKGCGYHLDLFILSILIQICSAMGLPWFVAATVLSINHVNSLKLESECAAPGDKPQFLGVREQRVTHILIFLSIGLSVFLTPMLGHIPMPVLFGVFLYMGVASLKGLQFFDRILIMFMPNKYQPDYMFLRQVPIKKVHLFTIIQIACLACLWAIKSFSQTSILFPLMLVVMIGIRKSLDCIFTRRELKILDDVMPEMSKRHELDNAEVGCGAKFARFILGPKLIQEKEYIKCVQVVKDA